MKESQRLPDRPFVSQRPRRAHTRLHQHLGFLGRNPHPNGVRGLAWLDPAVADRAIMFYQ